MKKSPAHLMPLSQRVRGIFAAPVFAWYWVKASDSSSRLMFETAYKQLEQGHRWVGISMPHQLAPIYVNMEVAIVAARTGRFVEAVAAARLILSEIEARKSETSTSDAMFSKIFSRQILNYCLGHVADLSRDEIDRVIVNRGELDLSRVSRMLRANFSLG